MDITAEILTERIVKTFVVSVAKSIASISGESIVIFFNSATITNINNIQGE